MARDSVADGLRTVITALPTPFDDDLEVDHGALAENARAVSDEGIRTLLACAKDEKNSRVEEVAGMLGIEDLLDRKPAALSGGQQQRVSLGRAMVMEPQAFLLDEPFSALDANLRDQMRTEIKKLQRTLETAMVFVTHDQEEAMTLGDKIVIMEDGLIQQIGSAYEIYNEPANKFVADFIGSPSTNMFECTVRTAGGDPTLDGQMFELTLSEGRGADLAGVDGDSVWLGVRPEHLRLDGSDPLFTADIEVIEPHGNHDAVHLSADGVELTAIVDQGEVGRARDSIDVAFDEDRMWLFDGDGDRLL